MESNIKTIIFVIDFIEEHISKEISLDEISSAAGYSKYHLHRMFTNLIGFSVHQYVKRRKLTEAAKRLLASNDSILEIALECGYDSQQAFTTAFKELYKMTPQKFRKNHEFHPIQLKFDMKGNFKKLKGDRIMDIKIIEKQEICLVGFMGNTKEGFQIIPQLWGKLHKEKNKIKNRVCMDYTVALNDYSKNFTFEDSVPAFEYYAAVEVSKPEEISPSMSTITLTAGKYVVFTYKGKSEDSLEPVMDYIYKEWFPESSCQFNENAKFDFIRYGEEMDEHNQSNIEVWVPIV